MDFILIGLFIVALGCIALLHKTGLIDKLNEKDDGYRAPFDITNPDYQFNIGNLYHGDQYDD